MRMQHEYSFDFRVVVRIVPREQVDRPAVVQPEPGGRIGDGLAEDLGQHEREHADPGSAAERAEELLSNADREMYAHKRSRAGVHRLLQLAESQPRSRRPISDQR